ncbi:MAG: pyruvate kinase [Vampirovibrionales bacterium]
MTPILSQIVPPHSYYQTSDTLKLCKIVATLGPASFHSEVIFKLIQAGTNVFRLNFSHADRDLLKQVVAWIREHARTLDTPIAILGDLQGPKIRVRTTLNDEPVPLVVGERVRFDASEQPVSHCIITTNTPILVESLGVGADMLLDDGAMKLKVIEKHEDHLLCEVIKGGMLKSRKGINIPGVRLNMPALTEKDRSDALFCLELGVDFLALSFVQSHRDVQHLRDFLSHHLRSGHHFPAIVSKIEKPQALEDIDAIIEASDAIMVARGDLGVELLPEYVPFSQKMIIRKSNLQGKPVITATQMMESMITANTPTRAEVSDIFNAVMDGTDAVMLSGESAVGHDPALVVQTMANVVREAAKHRETNLALIAEHNALNEFPETVAHASVTAAMHSYVKAMLVLSHSGKMASRISQRRPKMPIFAFTSDYRVAQRLSLSWGVYAYVIPPTTGTDETVVQLERLMSHKGLIPFDAPVVLCAGQTKQVGLTNTLKLTLFGESLRQFDPML